MRTVWSAGPSAALSALLSLFAGCTPDGRPGVHSAPPGTHAPEWVYSPGPYGVGDEVHILSAGPPRAGRVLEAGSGERAGQYRIRVDGQADSLGVWVLASSIGQRPAGITTGDGRP